MFLMARLPSCRGGQTDVPCRVHSNQLRSQYQGRQDSDRSASLHRRDVLP